MAIDVIIGRESGTETPRLCVKMGEKTFFFGKPGSVPKTVSRSHCRLLTDGNKMTISNVSDQNSLYVNGMEYKSKSISKTDLVELGPERYRLDLPEILEQMEKLPAQDISGAYYITHLKTIWDNYSNNKMAIQIRERKINALSAIPGVISMISIALSFIDGLRAIFITVAAVFALTFALVRIKSAGNVPLRQKELDERFQDEYVCPHCKHFLGNQRYDLVLRNGGCPWCKAKFRE